MFCQNCSTFDTDDARFCRQCGESLGETSTGRDLLPFRIWRKGASPGKQSFIGGLFDLSFERSALKRVGFIYRLAIVMAAASAFASIVIGFKISNWIGLFTLLVIAPLMLLFIMAFSRVILELFLIAARLSDRRNRGAEKARSGDEIEWNIGGTAGD